MRYPNLAEYVEYQIKTDPNAFKKLANEERIPWSLYAGVAGMPGSHFAYVVLG